MYGMPGPEDMESIRRRYESLQPEMDERLRRLWAASEARELGWGGVTAVAIATRMSRTTITTGIRELKEQETRGPAASRRIRRPGGGRKPLVETDPDLRAALERLVEPTARGDPESPLRWTVKSTRRLAEELSRQQHPVSARSVAALLHDAGYSLQGNRKTREGALHPDRNAQFEHINEQVKRFLQLQQPAISVDTKKKELVGDFKNGGKEWRPKGQPEEVRIYDFLDKKLGKAIPHGIYDLANNQGWVSVGITHDTAHFAANSILRWWERMGARRFSAASQLLITADGGGSNNYRSRLWKLVLQDVADATGLKLCICHFPPGTSKWNKIEHRLFCFITQNWRGKPLISHEAIINLIASTSTKTGLTVEAELDTNTYETGIKVSDDELAKVKISSHDFHGEWNYTISPRCKFDHIIDAQALSPNPPSVAQGR